MEAVGLLAGGVAHDFNNLLTAMIGFSALAMNTLPEDDAGRALLQQAMDAGERAAGLTQQLLAFSRKQVLQPQVLDLNLVVADMDRLLRRVIGEHIDLATVLAPELWLVEADPGQVEQVILNLAVNARDAMPAGGKLTIETANVELDATSLDPQEGVAAGPYVRLAITDTGHGMDAETQTRVFEPFFTTKVVGKGTGLGLSTVYGIVKQSGGHLWLYSEIGQGTTFKLYFPRTADGRMALPPTKGKGVLPNGTETVLLVEDEPSVRTLTSVVLRSLGYTVLEASQGKEALELTLHQVQPIDLLLTDMVMPEMGGTQVAQLLRARYPELRVLFMSGFPGEAAIDQRTLEMGAAFLQKPFTPLSLAQKVREVLDHPR
jgi:CheY-like chemotaxis protein